MDATGHIGLRAPDGLDAFPWPGGQINQGQLIERLGAELAAGLEPLYPERNPITLPEGIEFNA